jgi:luciferase-type oxidoreductase
MNKYFNEFETINKAYNSTFKTNKLSIGLVLPIEEYTNTPIPTMKNQTQRILLAEKLGFKTAWLRDIPFNVPSFGDVGQMYDPFSYLGFLAAKTSSINLAVGSIILPLRHPAHIAKGTASIDDLSDGRLILGIASGDRPQEYPAMNIDYESRGQRFRESFEYIKNVWEEFPMFDNSFGSPYGGMDMLPKPTAKKVPMLITGASQQSPDWLAQNGNGWITYPRPAQSQGRLINQWRSKTQEIGGVNKPVSQSLYIDLLENDDAMPYPIHLGYRTGTKYLLQHLKELEEVGVNHVVFNFRFNQMNIEKTLEKLAKDILPHFN